MAFSMSSPTNRSPNSAAPGWSLLTTASSAIQSLEGNTGGGKGGGLGKGREEREMRKGKKGGEVHLNCCCELVSKGELAELAALRLRSCAEALDSMDNISVIVVML
jgi:hypothetical protein